MKHTETDSDTMKAFLYLLRCPKHTALVSDLRARFKDCDTQILTWASGKYAADIMIGENPAIRLTLHGIALASEILTNRDTRFFNKAAFVVSIVALGISAAAAVLALF